MAKPETTTMNAIRKESTFFAITTLIKAVFSYINAYGNAVPNVSVIYGED